MQRSKKLFESVYYQKDEFCNADHDGVRIDGGWLPSRLPSGEAGSQALLHHALGAGAEPAELDWHWSVQHALAGEK